MTLDTNATEAHNVSEWLKYSKFDQLHHVIVGALVMFTSNVNVAKCVVNGATATVTSVYRDIHGVITTIGGYKRDKTSQRCTHLTNRLVSIYEQGIILPKKFAI